MTSWSWIGCAEALGTFLRRMVRNEKTVYVSAYLRSSRFQRVMYLAASNIHAWTNSLNGFYIRNWIKRIKLLVHGYNRELYNCISSNFIDLSLQYRIPHGNLTNIRI